MPACATTPEIDELLSQNVPVAAGVSGGKDSCALGFALRQHLDAIGHTGPRLLIHSDLGAIEWQDSLATCERLADAVGMELQVVRRAAGGMIERWQGRWEANLKRYRELHCIQLILPWSTPGMRFCTSELKVDVITSALKQRYPGQVILNASGVRRDESDQRKNTPIAKAQTKLTGVKAGTSGFDWAPLALWTLEDVLAICRDHDFPLHEAYGTYGSSRVSCMFCIMSSGSDLLAALGCNDHHDVYRTLVRLEADSSFGFQGSRWLGDLEPELLDADLQAKFGAAKLAAGIRQGAEATIPRHLLYTAGWPTCVPTVDESEILSRVRTTVAAAVGISDMQYVEPRMIRARYQELMDEAAEKAKKKKPA